MFKFPRYFLTTLLATLLITVTSSTLSAQSIVTGAIGGAVSDPQSAVVTTATVTVRNIGTNKVDTVTTDSEGRFRVTNLQPGTYDVGIQASGFDEFKADRVVVEVGQTTNLNATLTVGGTVNTVTVTSEAPVINLDSQNFSSNINQTSINELPINGRRWSNFAVLTPATVPDGSFGLISFRGISGLLNNNTVDGGDNNQAFFAEERGRTRLSYSISQSAIQEFQVNTSNYSAEYGRSAGGVVNAVTKSGTNDFHGDLFYFQRNNRWGARNPLAFQTVLVDGVATPVGIKPTDIRHQFGGTIGGPIVEDKLFFFFSYDQQKRNFPGLAIFQDPNYLNTVNRTLLNSRGLTNTQIDSTLNFLNSVTGPVPRTGDQTLVLPKIDWHINDKNVFSATYNRLRWESPAGVQTQATNTLGTNSFGDDFVKNDTLNLRLASTLTPTILNEGRFQYSRDFEFQTSQPPAPGEPTTALDGSSPEVILTNGVTFGKPNFLERAAFPDEKHWQFADTMTVLHGKHNFKFGFDINRFSDVLDNLRLESGSYSYNNINDFIIDYVNFITPGGLPTTVACATSTRTRGKCYTGNFLQGFGPTASELSTTDLGFFFQDDWRVTSKLTLNLGVRYEYEKFPEAINPSTSTALIPNTGLTIAQATSQLPSDKNNIGPRLGLAYDIFGDGKTSLRAGYGIYYGRIINSTISNALVNTGNAAGQQQITLAMTNAAAPIFPNVLPTATASGAVGAIQYFAPGYDAPTIHQGDLSLEREIAQNTVVSASYIFSIGRHLPIFLDRNLAFPSTTRTFNVVGGPFDGQTATVPVFSTTRPVAGFSQLTEISGSVNSDYQAFVLQGNRRFTNGLQFQASYTLAKATDTGQSSITFTANNTPLNVFDLSSENATSNLDVRNKVVVSAVYSPEVISDSSDSRLARMLLNDWTLSPIYSFYSGVPFNGNISGSGGGAGSLNASGGANRFPLVERNSFRRPSTWNVDLRLSRRFSISENVKLEVLAEAFNIFNRTQVTNVNTTFYNLNNTTSTLTFNSSFGQPTETGATLFRERQIQLGGRLQF